MVGLMKSFRTGFTAKLRSQYELAGVTCGSNVVKNLQSFPIFRILHSTEEYCFVITEIKIINNINLHDILHVQSGIRRENEFLNKIVKWRPFCLLEQF